jgi:outer membrane protein assembly factor BamD
MLWTSCSSDRKIIKSGTPDEQFELALSYYNNQKYHRSFPVLQNLLNVYRESAKLEKVYYYLAYSLYGMGEYLSAARYFYSFTETFIRSTKVEECFYMYCLCQYHSTDPSYLDQTLSKKTIDNFQLFLNLFPGTIYQDKVNEHIDELRSRLQKKTVDNAMLYFKMRDYRAAIVALQYCIDAFPDLVEKEMVMYNIVLSAKKYAELSIESKQWERYKEALKHSNEYFEEFGSKGQYFNKADMLKIRIEDSIYAIEWAEKQRKEEAQKASETYNQ